LTIIPAKPVDIAERLIYDLMVKVFKKLRNKIESLNPNGYTITLSPEEAKAYYIYFHTRDLGLAYIYESNVIQGHINLIDKIYA
jgi:hypothetical protein